MTRDDRRRAAEARWMESALHVALDSAYTCFLREGRGVIFVPMLDVGVDVDAMPRYIQATRALESFGGPAWYADVVRTYDPRTEVVVVFGYPDGTSYIRHSHALDLRTGRLRRSTAKPAP